MKILSVSVNDFAVSTGSGTYALDTVPVDEYGGAVWFIIFYKPSNGARIVTYVVATHNGRSGADATTGVYTEAPRTRTATTQENSQVAVSVVLVGTGVNQVMELRAVITNAAWTVAHVHRMPLRGQG